MSEVFSKDVRRLTKLLERATKVESQWNKAGSFAFGPGLDPVTAGRLGFWYMVRGFNVPEELPDVPLSERGFGT